MPEANTTRTTPSTTWLTRYLIENTASRDAISTPLTAAAASPAAELSVTEATTAAVNAPTRNWPSIAMLITPERSHSTPHRAPRISGVAKLSVPWNWFASGNTLPDDAQHRNAPKKQMPTTAPSHPEYLVGTLRSR